MVTYGISTWSIHRGMTSGALQLIDVPAKLRAHGMTDLQICHFHIPSQDEAALTDLRNAITSNGVTLDALLIDFGDLSHPEKAAADAAAIEPWLTVAARLGARHARISAGASTPNDETLARAAQHLSHLADVGDRLGVRVITENWHAMQSTPDAVERLALLTGDRLPLCLDFGNWSGPTKYDELTRIASRAVTVHAKCTFAADGTPDAEDFRHCCAILRDAGYAGTLALIYDGVPTDEWRYIDAELALARAAFGAPR